MTVPSKGSKPSCEGSISDIPIWNKDNEYVKSGYRVNYVTNKEIAWSFFQIHNETVNVWSHFLGKMLFLSIGLLLYVYHPNMQAMGHRGMEEFQASNLTFEQFTFEKL